jgi:hypothetical protein
MSASLARAARLCSKQYVVRFELLIIRLVASSVLMHTRVATKAGLRHDDDGRDPDLALSAHQVLARSLLTVGSMTEVSGDACCATGSTKIRLCAAAL